MHTNGGESFRAVIGIITEDPHAGRNPGASTRRTVFDHDTVLRRHPHALRAIEIEIRLRLRNADHVGREDTTFEMSLQVCHTKRDIHLFDRPVAADTDFCAGVRNYGQCAVDPGNGPQLLAVQLELLGINIRDPVFAEFPADHRFHVLLDEGELAAEETLQRILSHDLDTGFGHGGGYDPVCNGFAGNQHTVAIKDNEFAFHAIGIAAEDMSRHQMYRDNFARRALKPDALFWLKIKQSSFLLAEQAMVISLPA